MFKRLSILLLLSLVSGCGNGDYEKPLPNGYVLARTNASTTAIYVKSGKVHGSHATGGIPVAAKIDRVAVVGNSVVGHVASSPQSELFEFERPGYFILDTVSGQVELGLSEKDWRNQLDRQGLSSLVRLGSPQAL